MSENRKYMVLAVLIAGVFLLPGACWAEEAQPQAPLGETATVLADTTETERIMDLYCLLPVDRKIMVLNAVETALTVGGV